MDDDGVEFRATKDVDIVVLTRSTDLNKRILAYIKDGGYRTKESTARLPRYYRFNTPANKECPAMIEIFARNELGLELEEAQHIIPIENDAAEKLSAILLDDEYFELIQKNIIFSVSGIPLINAVANICLKARAYRELLDRQQSGDKAAEEKSIQKHLKDIWRLGATFTGDEVVTLAGAPAKDLKSALGKLEKLPEKQFAQVMENIPGAKMETIMAALKKVFLET